MGKPIGWADFSNRDNASYHFFGDDGRSLCGKWANLTRNILEPDSALHDDSKCAACRKKRATMLRKATPTRAALSKENSNG